MTLSGAGNGFPAPPECLQKVGGFRCNWEEPGRTNGDVERRVYQQFDQKRARSRGLSKRLLTECNSRRLHSSSEGLRPSDSPTPSLACRLLPPYLIFTAQMGPAL